MEINYGAAGFWWGVFQFFCTCAVAVWAYLRTKDNDNQKAIALLAAQLREFGSNMTRVNEGTNNRLTRLEEMVQHMPTNEEIGHLVRDVATVKAQVNGVAALLERVEHQTQLIHEHLLNKQR